MKGHVLLTGMAISICRMNRKESAPSGHFFTDIAETINKRSGRVKDENLLCERYPYFRVDQSPKSRGKGAVDPEALPAIGRGWK